MSATVGAALKKIAVALFTNPKVLKTVLGIVLGICGRLHQQEEMQKHRPAAILCTEQSSGHYSAGSIRPRPAGNGEAFQSQPEKAERRKNRTRKVFQQICLNRTAGLWKMRHRLPQSRVE